MEDPSTVVPAGRGAIRDPQNFVAGLALIGVAAFALWASSDLPLGRLGAFGPGLLPRVVIAVIALFGAILAVSAFLTGGDRVKLSDYSAVLTITALGAIAGVTGWLLMAMGMESVFGLHPVALVFTVLYIVLMLWLVRVAVTNPAWLDRSGLRGPIFVVGGLIAFALTVRSVGLIVAGPLLAFISGSASSETRVKELLIFAFAMTALCIVLFKYALKLPMPVLIIPGVIYI